MPSIVFVITDGKSSSASATLQSAKTLHARNITVFAVGVKGANIAELRGIASELKLVYSYTDFNKLAEIQQKFSNEACKGKQEFKIYCSDQNMNIKHDNIVGFQTFLDRQLQKAVGRCELGSKTNTQF